MIQKLLKYAIPAEQAPSFLDHFHARLRAASSGHSASPKFDEDGNFVCEITAQMTVNGDSCEVHWVLVQDPDGGVATVTADVANDAPEAAEQGVIDFFTVTLNAALSDVRESRFIRKTYYYVGPALPGEYWFGPFRFGPAFDDEASSLNAENLERVICIDAEVSAVDGLQAVRLSGSQAARLAARLSFLLDRALYRPGIECRWVSLSEQPPKAVRGQLGCYGHPMPSQPTAMPEKGVLAPLASFTGSIAAWTRPFGLPDETRRILRISTDSSLRVRKAFDGAVGLYRLALLLEASHPTAAISYMVGAVEAAGHFRASPTPFCEFLREFSGKHYDAALADQLYGAVRSAHFHSGQFPLRDFEPGWGDPTDIAYFEYTNRYIVGRVLMRSALVNWVLSIAPEAS